MSTCPQCTSTSVMSIAMTLNGGPVQFGHCRRCEHRWWVDTTDGGRLGLTQVLDKVSTAA